MGSKLEASKYETTLHDPKAVERFRALLKECRPLVRQADAKLSDGEVMGVCAYITGREFPGSAATRSVCSMLTCVSPKYFDRAIEIVQVLRNKSLKRHTRQPTLISLAYKYSFDESQIKQVRALQSAFTDGIGTDLRDDRVVCALFWVVCPYFGYDPMNWIEAEIEEQELPPEDVKTIRKKLVKSYSQVIRRILDVSGPQKNLKVMTLVRKRSDEALDDAPTTSKRRKTTKVTGDEGRQQNRYDDSVKIAQAENEAVLAALEEEAMQNAKSKAPNRPVDEEVEFTGIDHDNGGAENGHTPPFQGSSWESLAMYRETMIRQKGGESRSSLRPVFPDRLFYTTGTPGG